jgi:hypothetical protein
MAKRYELSDTVFSQVDIPSGQRVLVPADGESFTVQDLRGNPLPIYTDRGGLDLSLSGSSSQGNLNGWVDAPDFDVVYPDGSRFAVRNTPPGWFHPKSHGARFDDTIDDTAAIQFCMDAGPTILPPGTAYIPGGLLYKSDDVRLEGSGVGKTKLRYDGAGAAITNSDPTVLRRQGSFKNFTVDLRTAQAGARGIELDNAYRFVLEDLHGDGLFRNVTPLKFIGGGGKSTYYSRIMGCHFSSGGPACIDLGSGTGANTFIGGLLDGAALAVLDGGSGTNRFIGVNIEAAVGGVTVDLIWFPRRTTTCSSATGWSPPVGPRSRFAAGRSTTGS